MNDRISYFGDVDLDWLSFNDEEKTWNEEDHPRDENGSDLEEA